MSKKSQKTEVLSVQTRPKVTYDLVVPQYFEDRLYKSLRDSVPLIDASISKIRRLIGSFKVVCDNKKTEIELEHFLRHIRVGASCHDIDTFIGTYIEELLTYGSAIGEIVLNRNEIAALYNGNLEEVQLKEKSPLVVTPYLNDHGQMIECPYPELIIFSALNPMPGEVYGVSILKGLPFIGEILLKIYNAIGVNWERLGNVRFSVSCKQDNSVYAPERAKTIGKEWQKAMRSSDVSDFISLGDVSIKAIGSDIQLMDSEIPAKQMLEQIVAKLGIPPFLLGFSWSSTERMSSQQSDILTSELEYYRRTINPVLQKIIELWLRLRGEFCSYEIQWDDISMQDEVDHAGAEYTKVQTRVLEQSLEEKKKG